MKTAHRFGQKKSGPAPSLSFTLLSQHPIFSSLPENIRRDLVADGSVVRIPKYSLLFHQGDEVTAVYLILEGLVKLYRDLGDTDRTLTFLYKADVLGLDALYSSEGHACSAQAVGFVTACAFSKESVQSIAAATPEFSELLLKEAARQCAAALHEQDVLFHRSTNGRIADKILRLGEKFGKVESHGMILQLRITQRELASMAGTNRESVCKALLTFKREGSIDIQNKLIIIKNQEKLASWP